MFHLPGNILCHLGFQNALVSVGIFICFKFLKLQFNNIRFSLGYNKHFHTGERTKTTHSFSVVSPHSILL